MKNGNIKVYRGDSIEIDIICAINPLATYRSQLRQTPESAEFLSLAIEQNKILITSAQSETLSENTYYVELEENLNGKVTTIQRTSLILRNDVTRTYGNEAPSWTTDQSVEVAEMIAKNVWIRTSSGGLVQVGANAYQIAVAEGFEGTYTQWLASLIGPKGDKGDKGETGPAWQIVQVAGVVISTLGWTLVNGLYEKSIANANITALKVVDVIPDNSAFDAVSEAVIYPRTESSLGSVKIFALNIPTVDIVVTLNIY